MAVAAAVAAVVAVAVAVAVAAAVAVAVAVAVAAVAVAVAVVVGVMEAPPAWAEGTPAGMHPAWSCGGVLSRQLAPRGQPP